jgi:hypothetical protein
MAEGPIRLWRRDHALREGAVTEFTAKRYRVSDAACRLRVHGLPRAAALSVDPLLILA